MASVTLPSGQTVELHEPTFGEELHVVAMGADNLEEFMYLKCALIAPGLTREEIAALTREDGRALIKAVAQVWDGRPDTEDGPFANGSVTPSTDSIPAPITPSPPARS